MTQEFYSPSTILKYRGKVKLSEDILQRFLEIKRAMPNPTIKIKNTSKKKSDKWFCKKFTNDTEKIKKKINGYLNKFTDKNYIEITDKLLKLKIDCLEMLNYLTENFFEKMITENYYIDHWTYLLDKMIFNNRKWNFELSSFMLLFYNKLQEYFENMIEEGYFKKMTELKVSDIKEYYKEKKRNKGFACVFSRLYKMGFISDKLLNKCLGELLSNKNNEYHVSVALGVIDELRSNKRSKVSKNYYSHFITAVDRDTIDI